MSQAQVNLFKSRPQTIGYVFKSGRTIHFVNHQYTTTAPDEIAELTAECKANDAFFYIEGSGLVDKDALDPLAGLKKQLEAEIMAKLAAQGNPLRDMGQTAQELKVGGIANSQTINGMAAATQIQAEQARVIIPATSSASPSAKKL